MNYNTDLLKKAYYVLSPLAEEHTPSGSHIEATIDQWMHAIAYNNMFFSLKKDAELIEDLVKNILIKEQVLRSKKQFYNLLFKNVKFHSKEKPSFRFIDLFAGIGGFRLAFQDSGGVCVFSSEFDKHAQETYKKNYGETPFGDITLIPPKSIPDHDILLAGFPCQPFSHAGLKLGIEDTRGTLFHDISKILDCKKPKFAVLENVKGLISHDKGRTLTTILKTLTKIGYNCNIPRETIEKGTTAEIQLLAKKMILRSVDFGVPQNRQRIYIVLWRDNILTSFNYPTPKKIVTTNVGSILETDPSPDLTISDKLWEGHQRRKEHNTKNGKGFGFGCVTHESQYTNTLSARYYKDGSEILIYQNNKNPRKLSIKEAARLQGFPDEFEPSTSKVQAYKQFGNSVTVPVVAAIAKNLAAIFRNQNE